jgi:hypothetical protein
VNHAPTPLELLTSWMLRQLPPPDGEWLSSALEKMAATPSERTINLTISMVTRKLGKADLSLTDDDLTAAQQARTGWDPTRWSMDQAGRVAILLASASAIDAFCERLDQLCRTADVGELVAFYQGLPLYPAPERHHARAAEGIRTNMRGVFEAVAHANPYPTEHLDEGAWNQMVLKALFVGSTLHPIQGLDARCNRDLAGMLCDYAEERWSAGRAVSPELWRGVGPFTDDRTLQCLERALNSHDKTERRGAALALHNNGSAAAAALLNKHPSLAGQAERGEFKWDRFA